MTIKADLVAGNEWLKATHATAFNLPAGDHFIIVLLNLDGLQNSPDAQYLLSNAPFGVAGSIQIAYRTAASTTDAGKVVFYAGTASTVKGSSAQAVTSGCHYFVIESKGTTTTIHQCPVRNTPAGDGSSVLTSGAGSAVAASGQGLSFFNRFDLPANRLCDQSLGRIGAARGSISKIEIERLANGEELTDLGKDIVFYYRMDTVDDIGDRGPSNVPMVPSGNLSTSAVQPAFGYVPPAVEPTGTLVAAALPPESGFQRIGTSAVVEFTGTWTGTKPTAIDYQLRAEDRTSILRSWYSAVATINDNGTWTAKPAIPQGGMYYPEFRSKNGAGVIATSTLSDNLFGVGELILYGPASSSGERMFLASGGTGLTPAHNVRKFNENGFARFGTDGAAITVANALAAQSGVPIFMMDYGVGGTTLADWLVKTGAQWKALAAGVAAVGGKIGGAIITAGINDAFDGIVTSTEQHCTKLRQAISNLRDLTGQPALPVCVTGANRRNGLNADQANWVRAAENLIGDDDYVTHIQTMDFPIIVNEYVHLTPAGFIAKGARIGAIWGRRMYGDKVYIRGPKAFAFTWTGNTVRASITHRNGTDFMPTTGILYFTGSDDNGALTFTAARSTASEIIATADRAIVGTLNLDYLGGGNPGTGTQVFDNGSTPLPMMVETELAATQGSAPPANTTRTVSFVLAEPGTNPGDAPVPLANLTGLMVSFHAASGPHQTGAALYQSATETTDGQGALAFSFSSTAIAAGASGMISVLAPDKRNFLGLVAVA